MVQQYPACKSHIPFLREQILIARSRENAEYRDTKKQERPLVHHYVSQQPTRTAGADLCQQIRAATGISGQPS
jgi:hypothetical protein